MNKNRKNIIILDAYNVIHRVPSLARLLDKNLAEARDGLLRFCANWMATRKDFFLFYVVFDGQSNVIGGDYQPANGIRTVFTNSGEQADTRIIQIVEERKHDCSITVVSDDNFVRKHSKDLDASILPVADFFSIPSARGSSRTNSAEDKARLSPKDIKNINESLKDEWGIE